VAAVFQKQGQRRLQHLHWGLVPFWAKAPAIGRKMINARSETIAAKPAFRQAFLKRRCLIPADGYYEWQGPKGNKQPHYLYTHHLMAFAGLWETWADQSRPENEAYHSCTIITAAASPSVREIHHRMPVILKPQQYQAWLAPDTVAPESLLAIIKEGCIQDLQSHPVSKWVNAAAHNDARCIEPVMNHKP
jgi:putative SOS response-associated peptidase YedK